MLNITGGIPSHGDILLQWQQMWLPRVTTGSQTGPPHSPTHTNQIQHKHGLQTKQITCPPPRLAPGILCLSFPPRPSVAANCSWILYPNYHHYVFILLFQLCLFQALACCELLLLKLQTSISLSSTYEILLFLCSFIPVNLKFQTLNPYQDRYFCCKRNTPNTKS